MESVAKVLEPVEDAVTSTVALVYLLVRKTETEQGHSH